MQNIEKSKTPFNLRLINHSKNVNNLKAIPACHHFKRHGHNFMKYAKVTLIKGHSTNQNIKSTAKTKTRYFGLLNSKHLLQRN